MYDFFPLRLFSVFCPSSYFPVPCALKFCPVPSLLLAKGGMQADVLPPTHCFASCIFSHDNKNVWLKIKKIVFTGAQFLYSQIEGLPSYLENPTTK